ncbi:unnamed protein product [Acanthoscelides obtectus]|uniref:Hydroxypyruvate isomerase n=1 Tax=Acanthoscelides obtectus TaxID=200917 RepID=A0A9P0Q640_ACAOB|nr:unnamed protein product [Acanthoscelides obtectus]CAK1637257.1 Putative hydroxypyruvate isomerase [Acanthoscelides obtectus]
MLDIFHLQMIRGNITNTMKELKGYIGHVQELKSVAGYEDWIGLEYKPASTTAEGLKWIQDLGYNL